METLFRAGVSNAVSATFLAMVVACLSRPLARRPAILHCLWLLVLLKLVTPPLYEVAIPWPASSGPAERQEAAALVVPTHRGSSARQASRCPSTSSWSSGISRPISRINSPEETRADRRRGGDRDRLGQAARDDLAGRDRDDPHRLVSTNPAVPEPPARNATGVAARSGLGRRDGEPSGLAARAGLRVGPGEALADDLVPGMAASADHPEGPLEDARRTAAIDPDRP